MPKSARLIKPTIEYRDAYISFYEDWIKSGEDMVPWVIEREPEDFNAMIDFLYAEDTESKISSSDRVPHSTYWLLSEDNLIVGAVNIRHRLNEKLLNQGGHIGYGVRPSERRKGYANIILSNTLELLKGWGHQKVLVVCDKGNIGSEKTILKNGGVMESEFVEENGNIIKRFWIDL